MVDDEIVPLKFVILGEEGVGKTSIIRKFCLNEQFQPDYVPTVGLDIYTKTIALGALLDLILGDANVSLKIYDVSGKVVHSKNIAHLLWNADALLLVFDVSHVGSFTCLQDWLKVVQTHQSPPVKALICHKMDLLRNVSIDDQLAASKDYQLIFNTEVSTMSDSIHSAFIKIASEILAKPDDSSKDDLIPIYSGSCLFDTQVEILNKPSLNLSNYKLELVDHPKAGNLSSRSSLSKLSMNKSSSRRQSVIFPSISHVSIVSPKSMSQAGSRSKLGSTVSMSKLSRSSLASPAHFSIPVDITHMKAIETATRSLSVQDFIIIRKSPAYDLAVLEQFETDDQEGTLKFQLFYLKNSVAETKLSQISTLVQDAKSINYIFVSSLLSLLPSNDSLVFVLDYHSANLQQILNQNHRRMHEKAAKFYMAEILMGLEYLHDRDIIFKDLCTENVLITETGHVKLVNPIIWNGLYKVSGTPGYIAPETIHQNISSKSSDIWSFGCILFELLTGDTPFPRDVKDPVYDDMIIHGTATPIKNPTGLSSSIYNLIDGCLKVNASERLGSWKGCMDLKCHPWFKIIPRWRAVEEYLLTVPMVPDLYYFDPEKSESFEPLESGHQILGMKNFYF